MSSEMINLNLLYQPQDGSLEIGLTESSGYTKVTVFENDRPHCYTKTGAFFVQDGVIRMVEGIGLVTPANKDLVVRLTEAIGKKVDLDAYPKSEFDE